MITMSLLALEPIYHLCPFIPLGILLTEMESEKGECLGQLHSLGAGGWSPSLTRQGEVSHLPLFSP